jgi:hypothetical protein
MDDGDAELEALADGWEDVKHDWRVRLGDTYWQELSNLTYAEVEERILRAASMAASSLPEGELHPLVVWVEQRPDGGMLIELQLERATP